MPERTRITLSDFLIGAAAFAAVASIGMLTSILLPSAALPVTAGCAVAGVLIVVRRWKNTMFRDLHDPIAALRSGLADVRVEIEETRAMAAIQEPGFSIPLPWSNWALPPRGLLEVLKTVQQFEAPTVVDCGSGVSTLHIARAIRAIGRGRIIALEQDADWAEYIRRMLARNGLDQWATIVTAPIEKAVICNRPTSWYAVPAGALPTDAIDIVLVDGPRGPEGDLCRFGALPRLWDQLSPRAAVFLDDTNRPEEQMICRLWRENFPVAETSLGSEHGMSRFTRRTP